MKGSGDGEAPKQEESRQEEGKKEPSSAQGTDLDPYAVGGALAGAVGPLVGSEESLQESPRSTISDAIKGSVGGGEKFPKKK